MAKSDDLTRRLTRVPRFADLSRLAEEVPAFGRALETAAAHSD